MNLYQIEAYHQHLVHQERLDLVSTEHEKGWSCNYNEIRGLEIHRTLRGVTQEYIIDNESLSQKEMVMLDDLKGEMLETFGKEAFFNKKEKDIRVTSPSGLLRLVLKEGERGLNLQRYKGLGEMNADQLWETTLDPKNRSLIQVKIEDEAKTKGIFENLMGENVQPRKDFIDEHASNVVNLDI